MKRYRVVHTSEYRFSEPVSDCRLGARLRPKKTPYQWCSFFQIVSRPPADAQRETMDAFSNHISHLYFHQSLQRLTLSSNSTVTVDAQTKMDVERSSLWSEVTRLLHREHEVRKWIEPTELTQAEPMVTEYSRSLFSAKDTIVAAARALMHRIHSDMTFVAGATDVATPAARVLQKRQGVCQDFTHLALACLRSVGLPARYVSGYLNTSAFRCNSHRIASDASHAWFSVCDPRLGWVDFDPTNNRMADDNYITVAWGRDYADVSPVTGTFEGPEEHDLEVWVDVQEEI